jgi:predicted nucleic acid-binding protein
VAKAEEGIALDTSVVVALLSPWHVSHDLTLSALEKISGPRTRFIIPAQVLAETYSVLTRLPAPHRISPADAIRLLEANFQRDARVDSLSGSKFWAALSGAAETKVAGGRTYDWLIAQTAAEAGETLLVTFNRRDFEQFETESLRVRVPEELL